MFISAEAIEKNPLVSVVIPSYNHEKYIRDCILSVIEQTYNNIELIVIDDGSTDNSVTVIDSLQRKNNFIFEQHENRGLIMTLNDAIDKYVHGKYFCMLGSDDYWYPEKIAKQVAIMEENPSISFLSAAVEVVFNENSRTRFKQSLANNDVYAVDIFDLSIFCSRDIKLISSCTIIKTKDLIKAGKYDQRFLLEDYPLWLNMLSNGFLGATVKEKMGAYRIHEKNTSKSFDVMFKTQLDIVNAYKNSIFTKTNIYHFWINSFNDYCKINKTLALFIFKNREIPASAFLTLKSIFYFITPIRIFRLKTFIKRELLLIMLHKILHNHG